MATRNANHIKELLLEDPRIDPDNPIEPGGPSPILLSAELKNWPLTKSLIARVDNSHCYQTQKIKGNTLLHLLMEDESTARSRTAEITTDLIKYIANSIPDLGI